jgi:hypothetical protein
MLTAAEMEKKLKRNLLKILSLNFVLILTIEVFPLILFLNHQLFFHLTPLLVIPHAKAAFFFYLPAYHW